MLFRSVKMIKVKESKGIRHTKKATHLIKIIDRSGSMSGIEDEMRSLLNSNIKQDRENVDKLGDTYLTLVVFDHEIDVLIDNAPIIDVEGDVSKEQTFSRGTTALYDAIGTALSKAQKFDKKGNIGFLVEKIGRAHV